MKTSIFAVQNTVTEWAFLTGRPYADPFNALDLDVVAAEDDVVVAAVAVCAAAAVEVLDAFDAK